MLAHGPAEQRGQPDAVAAALLDLEGGLQPPLATAPRPSPPSSPASPSSSRASRARRSSLVSSTTSVPRDRHDVAGRAVDDPAGQAGVAGVGVGDADIADAAARSSRPRPRSAWAPGSRPRPRPTRGGQQQARPPAPAGRPRTAPPARPRRTQRHQRAHVQRRDRLGHGTEKSAQDAGGGTGAGAGVRRQLDRRHQVAGQGRVARPTKRATPGSLRRRRESAPAPPAPTPRVRIVNTVAVSFGQKLAGPDVGRAQRHQQQDSSIGRPA